MGSPLQTRALAEGALMAALTALLALIGIYLPFLKLISNLVWVIPLVVVIVRHGLQIGLMTLAVAGVLLFLFSNPLQALFLILQFGGIGIAYGVLFRSRTSAGKALLIGTTVAGLSAAVVFSLSFVFFQVDLGNITQQLDQTIDATIEMYRRYGLLDLYLQQGISEDMLRQSMKATVNLIKVLFPAMIVTYAIFAGFVNFLTSRWVLVRLGYDYIPLPPFSRWQLPWYSIWGIIIGLGLFLAGDYWQIPLLDIVGKNLLYVYFPVLLVIGLSVIVFYLHKWNLAGWLKIFLLIIAFFNVSMSLLIILMIGLFDPLFNYRRL